LCDKNIEQLKQKVFKYKYHIISNDKLKSLTEVSVFGKVLCEIKHLANQRDLIAENIENNVNERKIIF
jgi:hypothetical protein